MKIIEVDTPPSCERIMGRRARQCIRPAVRQVQGPWDRKPWAACNGHSRKAQRNGAKVVAKYVEAVYF